MVWFKSCKRCGGDLYLDRDFYGTYVACMQCGAVRADFGEQVSPEVVSRAMAMPDSQEQAAGHVAATA